MKKILAVDGGGIRGLIPALVLAELERLAGKPAASLFDMVAGTSTGGIITVGLAAGVPATELAALYSEHGPEIFPQGDDPLPGKLRPRYSADPLENVLRQMLGTKTLAELPTGGPVVLVPCLRLTPLGAYFFKSWRAKAELSRDFPLWQVCRATSAAETYFPPAKVTSSAGDSWWAADGGTHCNNPAVAAWAAADGLWAGEELAILSLGTGAGPVGAIDGAAAQDWGAVEWVIRGDLVDVMMAATSEVASYELDCLGPRCWRLQAALTAGNSAMDDASASNLTSLAKAASDVIDGGKAALNALLEL